MASVGKLFTVTQASSAIRIFIFTRSMLARKHTNVKNAAWILVVIQVSVITRKSTLERNLSNVSTVENSSGFTHILGHTHEFTLESSPMTVRSVESPLL